MEKLNKLLLLYVVLIITNNAPAQLSESSWAFGFGGTYPRFMSIWSNSYSGTENYGAYVSLQRNFSENVALRFLGNYNYLESFYNTTSGYQKESVSLISTSLDLLYYLVPCDPVSPYFGAGFAGIYFKPKNASEPELNDNFLEYQMNLRAGAEWRISENWRVISEAGYFTPSSNKLDGENDTHEHKGLFGTNCDTYMNFNLGVLYYFSKGKPSQKCDLYTGVTVNAQPLNPLTIQDVEKIVKDNLPKEVIKEIIVENPITAMEKKWVLVGVNFDFNSAVLTKESFSILLNAVQVLTQNPDLKIEIQGYTDSMGSETYNLNLSERRAKIVMDYLVANGISKKRLEVKGFGESNPIADNKTIEGRSLNRRIEFKTK
ncbi:MAG: hypothetical protein A2006_11970 [Ignavibacteria bacterium GWC2_35_8]|nr:MAG: hypothetical protein A2006_11970 [Ignavibacteria bacterium GWC2_35_8]OGU84063.1 MAG: hypothetical protein A2W11_12345 [Ignavibacteria bacterium RBG_16_35_7]